MVEVKKGHDPEKILNLLFKYTDLQTTFGINMMVIADGSPRQLGLLPILDHYIRHQKNVITRRTQFDLEKAEKREHILLGLIIAVKNIDRVIRIIRSSKNSDEAKHRLMREFNLTGVQAQAILDMRLARLTNLEVELLENEYKEVVALIKYLRSILGSEAKLLEVIREELLAVKEKYADKRRTQLMKEEHAHINIDESEFMVASECTVDPDAKRKPQAHVAESPAKRNGSGRIGRKVQQPYYWCRLIRQGSFTCLRIKGI